MEEDDFHLAVTEESMEESTAGHAGLGCKHVFSPHCCPFLLYVVVVTWYDSSCTQVAAKSRPSLTYPWCLVHVSSNTPRKNRKPSRWVQMFTCGRTLSLPSISSLFLCDKAAEDSYRFVVESEDTADTAGVAELLAVAREDGGLGGRHAGGISGMLYKWAYLKFLAVHPDWVKGSRNIRKSAKVVTMSLEGAHPPRQLVTAWGCGADPPPLVTAWGCGPDPP